MMGPSSLSSLGSCRGWPGPGSLLCDGAEVARGLEGAPLLPLASHAPCCVSLPHWLYTHPPLTSSPPAVQVLRKIQAIAKKARTSGGGPATPHPGQSLEARRATLLDEQRRRGDALWAQCAKILAALNGSGRTKQYFGQPVDANYAPGYYAVIKNPMDLGTVKSELGDFSHGGSGEG